MSTRSAAILLISDTAGSLAHSAVTVVPDLHAASNDGSMTRLKTRLEGLRPLGFVSVNPSEFLVIYDGTFWIMSNGPPYHCI